jgi:uncharacterized protein with von Willebrand factor type A (vWA) domain
MMTDDLATIAARFGAALRHAGVPADPGRCERFARAVTVARPATRRELYLCALATLVSGQSQIETLERVFDAVFSDPADPAVPLGHEQALPLRKESSEAMGEDVLAAAARAAKAHDGQAAGRPSPRALSPPAWQRASSSRPGEQDDTEPDGEAVAARPALAAAAERLAAKDFAELTPAELLMLAGLMRKLTLAVPLRRSRRHKPTPHGKRTDLRATLRQARRTGGDPFRLARRAPARQPRRLVVLCDISGSMEPYARAMLQLLYCAAGGARAEVFTFATRLTRLTTTLSHTRPEVALQRAGQTAPDWLGGTRIGASIKEFNDTRGRAGLARGAVVVIISDGWDTGDPAVLRGEMERLSRVAHRIVWVNPRTKSEQYQPLAGGMAAAWPYCDAVVSAHTVHALDELTAALAHPARHRARHRPAPGNGARR